VRAKRREACRRRVIVVLEQGSEVYVVRQGNARQSTCSGCLTSSSSRRRWEGQAGLVEVEDATDLAAAVRMAVGMDKARQHGEQGEGGEAGTTSSSCGD